MIVFIVSETSTYCGVIKFCTESFNHAVSLHPLTSSNRKFKRRGGAKGEQNRGILGSRGKRRVSPVSLRAVTSQ